MLVAGLVFSVLGTKKTLVANLKCLVQLQANAENMTGTGLAALIRLIRR